MKQVDNNDRSLMIKIEFKKVLVNETVTGKKSNRKSTFLVFNCENKR